VLLCVIKSVLKLLIPPVSKTIYLVPMGRFDIASSVSLVDASTGEWRQYIEAASGSRAILSWSLSMPACNK
jgi:hypothetical protein